VAPSVFSASSYSWVIPVSTNSTFAQEIRPQTHTGDRKQALYNLFAACVHTMPLELLIENVERERRAASTQTNKPTAEFIFDKTITGMFIRNRGVVTPDCYRLLQFADEGA
jgi:hypothetical protein